MNTNQPITMINAFEVPEAAAERFVADWREDQARFARQEGFIDGVLYRAQDQGARFRFVNVARWESEAALLRARPAVEVEQKTSGADRLRTWSDLGIRMNPAAYDEEARY